MRSGTLHMSIRSGAVCCLCRHGQTNRILCPIRQRAEWMCAWLKQTGILKDPIATKVGEFVGGSMPFCHWTDGAVFLYPHIVCQGA
jgi:hypothetical protein